MTWDTQDRTSTNKFGRFSNPVSEEPMHLVKACPGGALAAFVLSAFSVKHGEWDAINLDVPVECGRVVWGTFSALFAAEVLVA